MFYEAAADMEELLLKVSNNGLPYFASQDSNTLIHKMDTLSCFAGGLYGQAAIAAKDYNRWLNIAKEITNTCHESYSRAETKLGPGTMRFTDTVEAKGIEAGEKNFVQRAATVESYFIMWRLTKDSKYREWGWEVVEALDEHAKTEAGYAGIKNVYQVIFVT